MGLALILSLVALLAMMTFAGGYSLVEHLGNATASDLTIKSRYAARAGLETVMNELGHDSDYTGNAPGNRHVGTIHGSSHLSFEVAITNNSSGVNPITSPDGQSVEPGSAYLSAIGRETLSGTQVAVAAMAGVAYKTRPNFNHAAYASGYMALLNSEVDAWESTSGSYSQRISAFTSTPGSHRKATIGGYALAPSTISLNGTSKLDGEVSEGPGAANQDPMSPHTTIAPGVVVAANPKVASDVYGTKVPKFVPPFHSASVGPGLTLSPPPPPSMGPPLPPPVVTVNPGAYGFLQVNPGMTVKLRSGFYYFEDFMEVRNAKIELDLNFSGDPAVVFVGKEARILANSEVNKGGQANELQLCFTDKMVATSSADYETALAAIWPSADAGSIATSKFTPPTPPGGMTTVPTITSVEYSKLIVDNSELACAASGAGLEIGIMGHSELYGALMGENILVQGSKIHQDLSLRGVKLTSGGDWNLGGVHDVSI